MQNYFDPLIRDIITVFKDDFGISVNKSDIILSPCRKEFEGEMTLVVFNWSKTVGKAPDQLANHIGQALLSKNSIANFNVVKGFLNISLLNSFWINHLTSLDQTKISEIIRVDHAQKIILEYCSPNTNKPLHLGHIRNILIGWSIYSILKSIGHNVSTTQVINDRGIAICKSMLAWKLYGEAQTPESTGIKGDHFIGKYYVLFETKFREEYSNWQNTPDGRKILKENNTKGLSVDEFFKEYKNDYFNKFSALGQQAKEMLISWEAGDKDTLSLWSQMNQWVYDGFEKTFNKLGVHFDSNYYESKTYLLGKDIIAKGLQQGVFTQDKDGSVWIDLTDVGLDRKIVLRSDGTSVYITQDLGTADQRNEHFHADQYIYVVANEQDYHFKVLKESLRKLQMPYADGIHHLSYGMVELPSGRMKSREGTIVDADELIDEVIYEATQSAHERGELDELSSDEKNLVIQKIAMSALKYFILKVQAKKKMIFNPSESVDMQGHTGPYIANAFVRIQSILRRRKPQAKISNQLIINEHEKSLILQCLEYKTIIHQSAKDLDPSHLANFLYTLAKDFHRYYHDHRILNAETDDIIEWRLKLCQTIGNYLEHGMNCLGISMPERM